MRSGSRSLSISGVQLEMKVLSMYAGMMRYVSSRERTVAVLSGSSLMRWQMNPASMNMASTAI